MSNEKPIIYGVLDSDRRVKDVSRRANNYIESRLVVEDGLTIISSVNIHGFVQTCIEYTDQPGVPVLTFTYDHRMREYSIREEPAFQKKG